MGGESSSRRALWVVERLTTLNGRERYPGVSVAIPEAVSGRSEAGMIPRLISKSASFASLIPAPLPAGGDSGDRVPGKLDEFVQGRFRETLDIAMGAIIHTVGIGHGGPDAIGLNSAGAKPRHI
jgi:hypothetical protein